ncbi:unnamed protein product [Arabidopsis halleri]
MIPKKEICKKTKSSFFFCQQKKEVIGKFIKMCYVACVHFEEA